VSNFTRKIWNVLVSGKYIGYAQSEDEAFEMFNDYVEDNGMIDATMTYEIELDNVYEDYHNGH